MSRTKVVEKSNFRIIEKILLRLYNKHKMKAKRLYGIETNILMPFLVSQYKQRGLTDFKSVKSRFFI